MGLTPHTPGANMDRRLLAAIGLLLALAGLAYWDLRARLVELGERQDALAREFRVRPGSDAPETSGSQGYVAADVGSDSGLGGHDGGVESGAGLSPDGGPGDGARIASPAAATEGLPSRPALVQVFRAAAEDIGTCGVGTGGGHVLVRVKIAGATGRPTQVRVVGAFAATRVSRCVEEQVSALEFPPFAAAETLVSFTYDI